MQLSDDQRAGVALRDKLQRAIIQNEEIYRLLAEVLEDGVSQNRLSVHNYLSLKQQLPTAKARTDDYIMSLAGLLR